MSEISQNKVQVVQRGGEGEFVESKCRMVIKGDRRYLNYGDGIGKFQFLIRGFRALYGVAKHSKFQAKLKLVAKDPAIIAQLDALSERIKSQFEGDVIKHGLFKPFLVGDAETGRTLVLKICDDSETHAGESVMGRVNPDDLCDATFSTCVYKYGRYFGFSHRLHVVKSRPRKKANFFE